MQLLQAVLLGVFSQTEPEVLQYLALHTKEAAFYTCFETRDDDIDNIAHRRMQLVQSKHDKRVTLGCLRGTPTHASEEVQ